MIEKNVKKRNKKSSESFASEMQEACNTSETKKESLTNAAKSIIAKLLHVHLKKYAVCLIAAVVFAACFTFCLHAHGLQKSFDEGLYDNVIRLHIVASSNEPEAQALKYSLRDLILSHTSSLTEKAKNADEASEILKSNLKKLSHLAQSHVNEQGLDEKIEVTLSKEFYPVRHYEDFTFPAGKYLSLRVLIGKAEGKNWWCVLYPSVCIAAASDTEQAELKLSDAGLSDKAVSAICSDERETKLSFYFLELLQNLKKHREESCCTEFSAEKNTEKPISALKSLRKT